MKKISLAGFLLIWLMLWPQAKDQTVIENPAKPLSPNAGRVVTLKEELRIADSGEGYYFKNPYHIKIAPDGRIFVQDEQKQLLYFDPQGRFVKNLLKYGQGPGEMTGIVSCLVTADNVILYGNPPKILRINFQGEVVEEFSVPIKIGFGELLSYRDGIYYFHSTGRPDIKGGTKWMDVPKNILAIADNGKTVSILGSFPVQEYVSVLTGGVLSERSFIRLIAVPYTDTKFFLTHSPEYLVKLFDTDKKEVVRQFRRAYKRVKRPSSLGGVRVPGGSGPEPPEYANDILGLHIYDDHLYVQTSTADKKKGIIIDVFDPEGRYIDNFYLKYSDKDLDPRLISKQFTFASGFVFFKEQTEEGLYVIKKCSLIGYR